MKTNTSSNDEHELEKEIFKEKARQLPYNDSLGYLEEELKGFKQGYAKCRADVEKIVDKDFVMRILAEDVMIDNEQGIKFIDIEDVSHDNREECDTVRTLFNRLQGNEKKVIGLRYGLGDDAPMTLEQIGLLMTLSKERVRQIQAFALGKMEQMVV